jgi:hypothetical protein
LAHYYPLHFNANFIYTEHYPIILLTPEGDNGTLASLIEISYAPLKQIASPSPSPFAVAVVVQIDITNITKRILKRMPP